MSRCPKPPPPPDQPVAAAAGIPRDVCDLCTFEPVSRPLFVGSRWNARLLISNKVNWHRRNPQRPAEHPHSFLRVTYFGITKDVGLPLCMKGSRVRRSASCDRTRFLSYDPLNIKLEDSEDSASSTQSAASFRLPLQNKIFDGSGNWLSTIQRWLTGPTVERYTKDIYDAGQTHPATAHTINIIVDQTRNAFILPSPLAPSENSEISQARVFIPSENRFETIPIEYEEDVCRYICISNNVDIAVDAATAIDQNFNSNAEHLKTFHSVLLCGTVPSFLPPTYSSLSLLYQYYVWIALMDYSNGKELLIDQVFYPLDVVATTKSLVPVSELIDLFSWHDNMGDFIVPPPAIVPPLPAAYSSPTMLNLLSSMGGGVQSSKESPAVLPFGIIGRPEDDYRLQELMEQADSGFNYLEWALSLIALNIKTNSSTEYRLPQVEDYLDDDEDDASEIITAYDEYTSVSPSRRESEQSVASGDSPLGNGDRPQLLSGRSGMHNPFGLFDIETAVNIYYMWKRQQVWAVKEGSPQGQGESFLCTSELNEDSPWFDSKISTNNTSSTTGRFKVSVAEEYLCQMTVTKVVILPSPICDLVAPLELSPFFNIVYANLEHQRGYPMFLTHPGRTMGFNFDFSGTNVSMAEVIIRLVSVETLSQPSLGVSETQFWNAQRRQPLQFNDRLSRNLISKRSGIALSQSTPPPRKRHSEYLCHTRRVPKSYVQKRRRVIKYEVIPVFHHLNVIHGFEIPQDIPLSFRNELVGLHYEIEVEFECISNSNGTIFKLNDSLAKAPLSMSRPTDAGSAPVSPSMLRRGATEVVPTLEPTSSRTGMSSASNRSSLPPLSSPSSNASPPSPTMSPAMSLSPKQQDSSPFILLSGPLPRQNVVSATWSALVVLINQNSQPEDNLSVVQHHKLVRVTT